MTTKKTTRKTPAKKGPRAPKQVHPQQVAVAGAAGCAILDHPQCVIPNRVREEVAVLDKVLRAMAAGQLTIIVNEQEE